MSRQFARNYGLEVSRGNIPNVSCIKKFGEAPDGIQTTATDIWDRADATPTQQIWVAPTQARIHAITSTSIQDDGTPEGAGTGAQAVRVSGLTSWDTAEVSEDVILNGTANVNTVNSYVIIHRMKVIEVGSTYNINAGTITATAATDATVTAQINIGNGQTEMAIYGVPSTQNFYLTAWRANIDKATAAATSADFRLEVCERPDLNPATFLRKHDISLQSNGTNMFESNFRETPVKYAGPCIIKVQAMASSNDIDGEASFDAYLVTE